MKKIPEDPDLLLEAINKNIELQGLELAGFVRGNIRGKTMNVPLSTVWMSLMKQVADVGQALGDNNMIALKKALADLRNVAGCMFLITQRELEEKTQ